MRSHSKCNIIGRECCILVTGRSTSSKRRSTVGVVGTLVERPTLFTVLCRMEDAGAESALSGFRHVLSRIESHRLSLMNDPGKEMTAHQRLTEATGVKVYFANPYSSWQRGINEITRGLLKPHFPKGIDSSGFTQGELDADRVC